MVNRGDSRGLSTIVATLLMILLTLVAVGIVWVIIKNVINQGTEEISLGKLTLDLEVKGVMINPAFPNNLSVKVKRNSGKGDMFGIKLIFYDGDTSEVIELMNYTLKELEERNIPINLSEISNSSKIQKVTIVPILRLESGKEVAGDINNEYEVPKTSITTSVSTCTPATCGTKQCGTWANGTCAGTLVCGSYGGGCQPGYTCNTTTGQCVAQIRVWTSELTTNGGFEWNNLTGWTTSGSYWYTTTGASPTTNWTTGSANGTYHAYTSNGADSNSYIYQDVDISAYATSIDAGTALVNASGWGISFEIPPQDWTRIQIFYLFANKTQIGSPVYNSGFLGIQPWWRGGVFMNTPPVGTRYVRIWGNTYEVGYGSGSLDSFSVKIGYFP